jgi:periplasmic protein TonB
MAEMHGNVPASVRTEPGHLSVKVDGLRPDEPVFAFERQPQRMSNALLGSLGAHAAFVILAVLLTLFGPEPSRQTFVQEPSREIVWLSVPGPGGGGGGGGNEMPEPPKKVELPGKEEVTVPAVKPPEVTPEPPKEPEPVPEQNLTIPAETLAHSNQPLPGVIEGVPDESVSQGTGTNDGGGTGRNGGIGPGRGTGLGEGDIAGSGGGVYRPGSGVEIPRVIREVKPQYTADAMRAKVQGTVWIEAVVMTDGSVGNVQVVRSLDQTFGLDQEALKAAKQWRFVPGTRFGRPVPVLITIELAFTLR